MVVSMIAYGVKRAVSHPRYDLRLNSHGQKYITIVKILIIC